MKHNDKKFDWRSASLLIPAIIFTAGGILYLGEVFFPGALTQHVARKWGTWLMVVGSEGGSLPAMVEVWRKVALGRAKWYDYIGTVISTFTTMLGFVIIWSREYSALDAEWMAFIRKWGPLVELPLSVLDFVFGCGLELGVYAATHRDDEREAALRDEQFELDAYERRMGLEAKRIKLEEMRRAMLGQSGDVESLRQQVADLTAANQAANAELDAIDNRRDANGETVAAIETPQTAATSHTGADTAPLSATEPAAPPQRRLTRDEWRAAVASMNGDRPANVSGVNLWLAAHGYATLPDTTARRWYADVEDAAKK